MWTNIWIHYFNLPISGSPAKARLQELVDPENNTSRLILRIEMITDGVNPSTFYGGLFRYIVKIDGEQIINRSIYFLNGKTKEIQPGETYSIYYDVLGDIEHEPDGTKTIHLEYSSKESNLENNEYSLAAIVELTDIGATKTDDFTEEDKEALRNNTAVIHTKLIVKPDETHDDTFILTEDNSIKSLVYNDDRYVPNQGWIGQFVARTLEGQLQNISDDFNIEDRILQYHIGVSRLNDDTTTWYSLGDFLVTKPEDNEVADNTKFTAMDCTKQFNIPFDGDFTNSFFPVSLNTKVLNGETYTPLWLAQYTCEQAGVLFTQETFVNSDFPLTINPFRNNETCRDVMKQIGKLAFSWVRIDWNNKCYIDFIDTTTSTISEEDTLDNNQYFTLETQKKPYGPINKVVFGLSEGIDGESAKVEDADSIATNGEHALYIYDNPLLPDDISRAEAIKQGSVLMGLTYIPLKTETIGHPWFKGNKVITVSDMENNSKYTIPFNRQLKYNGHIRSVIESTGETEVEATYAYDNEIIKELRNARIKVDKQEGIITEHTSRLEVVEDEFGNYYTIEKTNELINDAKSGLTNTYTTSGGNNIIKNSGLYFEEGDGFEYWEGRITVQRNVDSASGNSMILQGPTNDTLLYNDVTQTVANLPNGEYTISFGYNRLNDLATASVIINNVEYPLGNQGKFEQSFTVDNNTIIIDFRSNLDNAYEVWELMCNKGNVSSPWTQHANEVRTDMVNISKGITIESSAIKSKFKADADGIRIENQSENKTTEFTDDGMETDVAVVRKRGEITGALFTKVGEQTWINGL